MVFQQFRHEQGGCLSYLIGSEAQEVCAVVDPQMDIDQYLKYARDHRMKITHIFETHAQADHVSGATRLWKETGAPIHFHESTEAAFPIVRVRDGEEFVVGTVLKNFAYTRPHSRQRLHSYQRHKPL